METLKIEDVQTYVEENIGNFHKNRLDALKNLKLESVLKRKNPYLFKAKKMDTACEIVNAIVSAYISSQEETIFGNWLEGLAIHINNRVYGGMKSSTKGLDLEFENENVRYLVSIKSGPSWGNSSQISKMKTDFINGEKRVNTSRKKDERIPCVFVNGCCYGKDNSPLKTDENNFKYYKYCGQQFWYFISGIETLYVDIIEPLGYKAKEHNEEYQKELAKQINLFTAEFLKKYCNSDGEINWNKIVEMNSKAKTLD